ncbi:hypothetical protein PtrSN002B_002806 [Pyrenophora tritici-repentis]|uniref:Uncharacterized protein n=2 Tax=Pyrenophora tritici-repentis TaxID=45151 RepID=A0A2W1HSY0_9PLEO|nr:uncharacterized protein PTRG_01354 [Pyrenophora tritici-repentis Pt-1C-BFP]KAA8626007.1 hypothetical protein PtrV1_01687 [Pyrenophora tritici-repentis]EDU40792.1 hypothetical protein PTRG_01354 [Pyrenophora tritici-repentis Pt-1C-BFP]KAF7454420.1 hypothetical protein A1F99_016780 [Pyrenophora tritici-repentis]KAG9388165.1 hypothetical protein A1F94_001057 [Pyrenophora tritici-repentis]KAI0578997.1 hypothetical protein Alg130_07694 [Pyrenophora tritici-repentis]
MKPSTILATLTTFAATTLAAPSLPRDAPVVFKVQLSNDQSGKNANVDIIPNTGAKTFDQLFGSAFGNPVLATSLQAVTPGAGGNNVRCVVRNPAVYGDIYLNAWNTFVDLDVTSEARPMDVTAFTIECSL